MEEKRVEMIAEITVRRYFDHYLEEVWPEQLTTAITAHNKDITAHVQQIQIAIKAESSHRKLWLIGLVLAVGAGGGVGVAKVVAAIIGG